MCLLPEGAAVALCSPATAASDRPLQYIVCSYSTSTQSTQTTQAAPIDPADWPALSAAVPVS